MIDIKINQSESSKETTEYAVNTQTHDPELSRKICEGNDCFLKATFGIEQNVGNFGIITVFLCDGCLAKFSDCDYCRQEIEKSREGRRQAFGITRDYNSCIQRGDRS